MYATCSYGERCSDHRVWMQSPLTLAQPDIYLVEDANRVGRRVSSIGEVPYCDPRSTSRREALGIPDYLE